MITYPVMKKTIMKKAIWKIATSHLVMALAVAMAASTYAIADEWRCDIRHDSDARSFKPCWSIGAGLALSNLSPNDNNGSWNIDPETSAGWQLYGNYHFQPNWFAEVSYSDLGEASATDKNTIRNLHANIAYTVPAVMLGYYFNLNTLTNNLVPALPINPFLKFGVSAIANSSDPSAITFEQKSDAQLALSLGFEWRFHQNWKLRNQLELFDSDALSYNLSVTYIFGGSKKSSVEAPAAQGTVQARPTVSESSCQLFEDSNYNGSTDVSTTSEQDQSTMSDYTAITIQVRETDWDGSGDLPIRLCHDTEYQR